MKGSLYQEIPLPLLVGGWEYERGWPLSGDSSPPACGGIKGGMKGHPNKASEGRYMYDTASVLTFHEA